MAEGCNGERQADPTEDQMGLHGNTGRMPEDIMVCPFIVIAVTGAASPIVVFGHASAFPEESPTTLGAGHRMHPPQHCRNGRAGSIRPDTPSRLWLQGVQTWMRESMSQSSTNQSENDAPCSYNMHTPMFANVLAACSLRYTGTKPFQNPQKFVS